MGVCEAGSLGGRFERVRVGLPRFLAVGPVVDDHAHSERRRFCQIVGMDLAGRDQDNIVEGVQGHGGLCHSCGP